MKNTIKGAVIGVFIVILLAIFNLYTQSNASSNNQAKEEIIANSLAETAKKLNKQMPIRIDEITIVSSVLTVGTTIIYNYQVDLSVQEILEGHEQLEKTTINNVCTHPDTLKLINNGASMHYT